MFKLIIELGPVIVFFVGYKISGIIQATLYMLIASVLCIIAMYIKERKINHVNIISSILLLISSALTLFSGNSVFIKMKPTALYLIFALIFLVTCFKWTPAAKYALGSVITFKKAKNWYILNIRFMLFFIFMAIINEIVWRNFSENNWVLFKVFGAIPITVLFIFLQIPFIMKNRAQ